LPSFTERVNVRDGGIDAEWDTELFEDARDTSLLGPGWNVFQYKKRDVFGQGRAKAFSVLKAGARGALVEIYQHAKRRPDRYVFFCNFDLTHRTEADGAANPQKAQLETAILDGYEWPDKVHVEIVGAAELASLLNSCPHVRSAYFSTHQFSTWESQWNDHERQGILQQGLRLVGREEELDAIRSWIDDPSVRVMVLCGPSGIGKTRLALEATRSRPIDTVVALDPTLVPTDLLALTSSREVIVIVEDPETQLGGALAGKALASSTLKLLITFLTEEDAPQPNFGMDPRIRIEQIPALPEEKARELLREAGARFDYSLESWVLDQAGGNPGILIVAARVGEDLRREPGAFLARVAEKLERTARGRLGDKAVDSLRLLSLFTFVGVMGEHRDEVEMICKHLGDSLDVRTVLNCVPRLSKAGLMVHRGSYVEARPPVLASHLAAQVIRGRLPQLLELLRELDLAARHRLAHRLRSLETAEVIELARSFCKSIGVLVDLHFALLHSYLLRLAASAIPLATAECIEQALQRTSRDERQLVGGDARRELVYVLEDLLLRGEACATALRCLAWLAEAENESWSNNSTGVLCECFAPRHPQIAITPQERLAVLNWMLSPKRSTGLRVVGMKAIQEGLRPMASVLLRRGSGPRPPDAAPPLTWGELRSYSETLIDLLMGLAEDEEVAVSGAARHALPSALANCVTQISPERLLPKLGIALDWILGAEVQFSPSGFAESLRRVLEAYKSQLAMAEGEWVDRLTKAIAGVDRLRERLDAAPFGIRLHRWAGAWTRDGDDYEIDEAGVRQYRGDRELSALAQEAVVSPARVSRSLVEWLISPDAERASRFFRQLGRLDTDRQWLAAIEDLGPRDEGRVAFSSYLGGLALSYPEFVASRLDEHAAAGRVAALAIVETMRHLDDDPAGVSRIESLIGQSRVDPVQAGQILQYGRWLYSLDSDRYLRVLKAIARPDLSNAPTVVDMFSMWWHDGRPIEGALAEFAWQCLEVPHPIPPNVSWDYDQLAARLTRADPDRGFRLLAKLLLQPHENRDCWNPLERHGSNAFWGLLCEIDKERAFRTVFLAAVPGSLGHFRVTWALPELIDLTSDGETLVAFARADEALATLICECMSIDQPGFWPVALGIYQAYPTDASVEGLLRRAILHPRGSFSGNLWERLRDRRKEIERLVDSLDRAHAARSWLNQLARTLREWEDQVRVQEADEEINL